MSQREGKQFQSGREVFEKYIPGYTPPHKGMDLEERSWQYRSSPKEIADDIISPFLEKLSEILSSK
jgi:hypothetical protein